MESDQQFAFPKPKRCASHRKNNGIESVENYYRKSKLLPEFGVKYDHMFALAIVRNNFIDGYGKYPMPWSTKK
jgi:hypothetical protein